MGLGVPVAMGDGHGDGHGQGNGQSQGQSGWQGQGSGNGQGGWQGQDNGPGQGSWQGQAPNNGQAQPQNSGQGQGDSQSQGDSQGQGDGHGFGHDHGQGSGGGQGQPPASATFASQEQGGAPAGGHDDASSQDNRQSALASLFNGHGPNGDGPPGQLKKLNGSQGGNATGPRAAAAAATSGSGSSSSQGGPRSAASAASSTGNDGAGNNGGNNGAGNNGSGAAPSAGSSTGSTASSSTPLTSSGTTPATPAATTIPVPGTPVKQAKSHHTSPSHHSGSTAAASSGGVDGVGPLTIGRAAGSLSAAAGTDTTGGTGPITGQLAPGTASLGGRAAAKRHATHSTGSDIDITLPKILPYLMAVPGSLVHFISVIPDWLWVALAVAVALAVGAGVAAFRSRRQVRRQASQVAAVTAAALTDPLTGVLNRRGFLEAGERELDRARRYGHPLALAFVDIRGLKAVNDTEGHLAGDKLLKQVTMLLRESGRTHDLVGRIGGDELAVLLAEQSAEGAEAMTQRVRAQIPAYRANLGLVTGWDVTIGTATFPEDGDDLEQLLDAADRRLYLQRGIDLAK